MRTDSMFKFIKQMLQNLDKQPQYRIRADDARKIIQDKADAEYFDYKCRRQFLLKSIYESIKNLSLEGENYLIITSQPFVERWNTYKRWCQKDINWFAEDYKKDFIDDGYEFSYGQNPKVSWKENIIQIKW